MSLAEYPDDIVVKDKEHQGPEQGNANLLGQNLGPLIKRFTPDSLNGEKYQMTTIEYRDRQQVENTQVDTQQPHEMGQVKPAGPGLLTGKLGDQNGSAKFGSRNHVLDYFHHSHKGQIDEHPGLPD